MSGLSTLLEIFELEAVEQNIFRGVSYDLGFPNLFGGQVLGQALMAATQTVEPDRIAHSCHAYFLRAGDAQAPIVYQVNRIRDGRSFATRHIVAIQHGRPIFDMSASFQVPEEGYAHHDPMPLEVPAPESLKTQQEVYADEHGDLPEQLTIARPVEIRPVDPMDKRYPEIRPPAKQHWFRATEPMPDNYRMHQAMLAYASDFELLGTSVLPHGASIMNADVFAASLDHALWIHRPFRMDEWLLYDMESPNACNGRGLNFGRIYNRDGVLVASVAQEGLIRERRASPE